jgi:hypothetical protein
MIRTVIALAVGGILFALSAFAQFEHKLTTSVPFAFTAGTKQFPAGDYSVKLSAGQSLMVIQSSDGHHTCALITIPLGGGDNRTTPKLVFNRYADQYFLAEAWEAGGIGQKLQRTRAETEIARRFGKPSETILRGSIHDQTH